MTSRGAALVQSSPLRAAIRHAAGWPATSGLCVILLAPLLVVDVPPLLDYPNHLARAFILASLPGDAVLARFYAPHWTIIPNLALDLLALPLMRVLPVHVAGRLLIALAVLLPVLGTVAYNAVLTARKPVRWWVLASAIVAYNGCVLYGFLNFEISLGLALLLAAAWLRWRDARPVASVALAIAGALALFACHLMGLAFYFLLIGGAELAYLYPLRNGRWVGAVLTRGLVLLAVAVPPAALYAVSGLRQLGGDARYLAAGAKLAQFLLNFVNYNRPLDLVAAALVLAVPLAGLALRWCRVPGPAACTIVMLLIAFIAVPSSWKGTFFIDARFAIMLGFMLFAGVVPDAFPDRIRRPVIAVLTLIFVARMTVLTTAFVSHRTDLADLRAVLAPVQPGQAIYFASVSKQEAPAYWDANPHWREIANGQRVDLHLGALVPIEHCAFWPFEFDNPSQQPIETRQPYRDLAERVGEVPDRQRTIAANLCGFDDVLLLEADALPGLPDGRFRLLAQSGFAALYAVTQCQPGP